MNRPRERLSHIFSSSLDMRATISLLLLSGLPRGANAHLKHELNFDLFRIQSLFVLELSTSRL
jgi:hypothetical protein